MYFRAYGSQLSLVRRNGCKIWTLCTLVRDTHHRAFLKEMMRSLGNTWSCSTQDSTFSVLVRLCQGRVKSSLLLPLFFAHYARSLTPLLSVTWPVTPRNLIGSRSSLLRNLTWRIQRCSTWSWPGHWKLRSRPISIKLIQRSFYRPSLQTSCPRFPQSTSARSPRKHSKNWLKETKFFRNSKVLL